MWVIKVKVDDSKSCSGNPHIQKVQEELIAHCRSFLFENLESRVIGGTITHGLFVDTLEGLCLVGQTASFEETVRLSKQDSDEPESERYLEDSVCLLRYKVDKLDGVGPNEAIKGEVSCIAQLPSDAGESLGGVQRQRW